MRKKKIIYDAEFDTSDAEKSAENLGKSFEEAGDEAKKTAKETKDIGKAGKSAEKGVGLLSKGFKGLGAAMKGAGIGIIIGLTAKLTELFMENQSVVDATNKAFGTLKVVFQQFTEPLFEMVDGIGAAGGNFDALTRVGKALLNIVLTPVKLVFKEIQAGVLAAQLAWEKSFFGDDDPEKVKELQDGLVAVKDDITQIGKDAVESGKTIVNDFGEAFTEAANIAGKAGEAVKKGYENINLEVAQSTAEANVQLEKSAILAEARIQGVIEKYDLQAERQRQIRDNETLSFEKRIEANEKLGEILQEQLESQENQAQKVLDAARAKLATDKENIEFKKAVIEAENEVAATRAQIAGLESEQQVNRNALLREQKESLEELALIGKSEQERAILEAEQEAERQRELIERTITNEAEKKERLAAVETEYQNTINAIKDEAAKKQKEIDKKEIADAKEKTDKKEAFERAVANAQVQLAQGVFAATTSFAQEGSDFAKGVAVAQTTFETYLSAQKAYTSQLIPGDPSSVFRGVIAAASAIALGIANVRNILSTDPTGGAAAPSAASAPSAPAGLTGSAPITAPDEQNASNNVDPSEAIRRQQNAQQEPIPAYVLEGSVTNAQQAQRLINQQARL